MVDSPVHILDVDNPEVYVPGELFDMLRQDVQGSLDGYRPVFRADAAELRDELAPAGGLAAAEGHSAVRRTEIDVVALQFLQQLFRREWLADPAGPQFGVQAVSAQKRAAAQMDQRPYAGSVRLHAKPGDAGYLGSNHVYFHIRKSPVQ